MYMHITVHNCRTQHSTNSYDNLPTYPQNTHHCSDDVFSTRGEGLL